MAFKSLSVINSFEPLGEVSFELALRCYNLFYKRALTYPIEDISP